MIRAFASILAISLLTGCGLVSGTGNKRGAQQFCGGPSGSEAAAFSTTRIYGSLKANCASCHTASSAKGPSFFADPDPSTALSPAKRFANFSSPDQSEFVKRMNSGHNCGGSCSAWAADFTEGIREWAQAGGGGGKGCVSGNFTESAPQLVPRTLASTPQYLSYDMGGHLFQITVAKMSPTSYVLSYPTLAVRPRADLANVRVSQVHILINGSESVNYRNYAGVNHVMEAHDYAASGKLTNPPFSDQNQIVVWSGADGDQLSFRMVIEYTHDPLSPAIAPPVQGCVAKSYFDTTVMPRFRQVMNIVGGGTATCVSCHGGANSAAVLAFPMEGAGVDSCLEFKKKVNLIDFNASRIFYPTINGTAHAGGEFQDFNFVGELFNWMTQEAEAQ